MSKEIIKVKEELGYLLSELGIKFSEGNKVSAYDIAVAINKKAEYVLRTHFRVLVEQNFVHEKFKRVLSLCSTVAVTIGADFDIAPMVKALANGNTNKILPLLLECLQGECGVKRKSTSQYSGISPFKKGPPYKNGGRKYYGRTSHSVRF